MKISLDSHKKLSNTKILYSTKPKKEKQKGPTKNNKKSIFQDNILVKFLAYQSLSNSFLQKKTKIKALTLSQAV